MTFFCGIFSFSLDTAICYTHLVEENVVMINAAKMKKDHTKASVARFGGGKPMKAPKKSVFTSASSFSLNSFFFIKAPEKKTFVKI